MLPWLFNVHMDVVMKEVKIEMRKMEVRFLKEKELGVCLASYMQMTCFVW